jgi:HAD superfamily hydrolase (TIGR01548 family)
VRRHVAQVRSERERLAGRLAGWGVAACPSQANFLLADFGPRAPFVHRALVAQGILVRDFTARPGLEGALRISLPGDEALFGRLVAALELILAPQALLFDLDGVLADVRESYDACVAATAASFGVRVGPEDIAAARQAGDANNDWVLTLRLVLAGGGRADLEGVRERFQASYAGNGASGLRDRERLLLPAAVLERLAMRLPLGLVTGRPREEAERFLGRQGIAGVFGAIVALGDAPPKPAPEPVRLALERLGVSRAWLAGDTPDDMRAAAGAGVLPIGVVPPGGDAGAWGSALGGAGAAWTLGGAGAIAGLLP